MEQLINLIECKTFNCLDFYSKSFLEYNETLRLISNNLKNSFETIKLNLSKTENSNLKTQTKKDLESCSLLKKRTLDVESNSGKSSRNSVINLDELKTEIKNEIFDQIKKDSSTNILKNNTKIINISLEKTPKNSKSHTNAKQTLKKDSQRSKISQNSKNVKKNSDIFDKMFGIGKKPENLPNRDVSDKENDIGIDSAKTCYKKVKTISISDSNGLLLNSFDFKNFEKLNLYQLCESDVVKKAIN